MNQILILQALSIKYFTNTEKSKNYVFIFVTFKAMDNHIRLAGQIKENRVLKLEMGYNQFL